MKSGEEFRWIEKRKFAYVRLKSMRQSVIELHFAARYHPQLRGQRSLHAAAAYSAGSGFFDRAYAKGRIAP
jgi:hypothetical protein